MNSLPGTSKEQKNRAGSSTSKTLEEWDDYSEPEIESDNESEEYYSGTRSRRSAPSTIEKHKLDETPTNEEPPSKRRKVRRLSPSINDIENLLSDEKSTKNFSLSKDTPYLAYNDEFWNPAYLYRLPSDLTLQCIHRSGGEGVGRSEVGQDLMIDTSTKAGNRRVSSYIVNVCNDYKDSVGQYQKMEGKVRSIKYFWKLNNQPERFRKLFEDFEKFAGVACPFKLGQVIKFPNENLNTLRISDVTMRRLNDLMELVTKTPVVVTIHRILKYVEDKEKAAGYNFSIDKKSLLKCIKALAHEKLLYLHETIVMTDGSSNKIQILCHRDIDDVNSQIVQDHIEKAIDQYHKEGRVFPHGQLRYSVKKREALEKADPTMTEEDMTFLRAFDPATPLSIQGRYSIFRAMTARATVLKKEEMEVLDEALDITNANVNETAEITTIEEDTKPILVKQEPNPTETAISIYGDALDLSLLEEDLIKPNVDTKRVVKLNTSMANLYGYQAKALRFSIMHEAVYQFVHGHSPDTKPTYYDKFPLATPHYLWEYNPQPHVYVNEESPLRFIPPFPQFEGSERGWFMLQDFITSLPLSVYILCAYIPKDLDTEMLDEFLRDPIRRHTILGDLPNELRIPILRDKKMARQVEHTLFCLCAMGLMCVAQNPDPKRYVTASSTMFYVGKKGILYDTSTSEKGYATVTGPIERYQRYDFTFNSVNDVHLFWHNLRAIVNSTPLSFRIESANNETSLHRHKKYSQGQMDKSNITYNITDDVTNLMPLEPHDGCAGFDSALFLHLKRHWDLNPRPSMYVSWFIKRFRTIADAYQSQIETRIENLTLDWNSFVKSMMPNDFDIGRNKKAAARTSTTFYPATRASVSIEPKSKTRLPNGRRSKEHKRKRQLDPVDLISHENRVHVRSRFNAREKDMLILIRAIGFFLNPVYRFWLDPAVVRDIMHEYVPESRTKTIQSLMAAGVRELVRPNRLAYLQRIVRNLHTFQQMRDLRSELGTQNLATQTAKTNYFRKVFDVANNLLFMDNQNIPNTLKSDKIFDKYIEKGDFTVSKENNHVNPIPLRSRAPVALSHIHHCVAVNVLLGILIHSTDGIISERMLGQLHPTVIHNALQILRSDGLVSRTRAIDAALIGITKNQAVLSYYFRHFISHRFHPDIIEQTSRIFRYFPPAQPDASTFISYRADHIGVVMAACNTFYTNNDLEVHVDPQILSVYEEASLENAQQSTKQIRYLEHADLRLEEIKVSHVLNSDFEEIIKAEDLLPFIDKSHDIAAIEAAAPSIYIKSFLKDSIQNAIQKVYNSIKESGILGIKLEDIMEQTKLEKETVKDSIELCLKGHIIIEVGVDAARWIVNEFRDAWCVISNNRLVYPKPWTLNNGEVCLSTIRWMAESCLFTIVASVGIKLTDLQYRYEFALQPAAVTELVYLLEKAGCIEVREEEFESLEMISPFEEKTTKVTCISLLPTVDCVERFARIFSDIPLYPTMSSFNRHEDGFENEEMGEHYIRMEPGGINEDEEEEIDVIADESDVNMYRTGSPQNLQEALQFI